MCGSFSFWDHVFHKIKAAKEQKNVAGKCLRRAAFAVKKNDLQMTPIFQDRAETF